MWYYKARIYSPTLGRFMQVDPIGYEGGDNLYAYVGNDPVNQTDPDGTNPAVAGGIVIGLGIRCALNPGCRALAVSAARIAWREAMKIPTTLSPPNPARPDVSPAKENPGRNDPHINQDRKAAAERAAAEAKIKYDDLKKKPNKDPDHKDKERQARREYEHLKRKAEETGENHSQRGKGRR